jgi:acetolactate synthase I/II/III large subunit
MNRINIKDIEKPVITSQVPAQYGSDVIAHTLREVGVTYIALNPGASYRGLHDSLVNYLGNERPQILLCLHEESAIAIAHGYAKVTESAMAVALHSNVGLMHATMAIFNAWCDRVPILIIGATGPVDAAKRRPWIDWIHTASDQGALVRNYTKWDDQPASTIAARESILRASGITNTAPKGPVYVNLDVDLQESKLVHPISAIQSSRYLPEIKTAAPANLISSAANLLKEARAPLILVGRVSRSTVAWDQRVALAERLGAKVLTDLKVGAAFPTDHPLHVAAQGMINPTAKWVETVRDADVIISLDWVDLEGTLRASFQDSVCSAKVIQASIDYQIHRGWSMDYQGLPTIDMFLAAEPDSIVEELLQVLGDRQEPKEEYLSLFKNPPAVAHPGPIKFHELAASLKIAVGSRLTTLTRLPLTWDIDIWPFRHPLDYLGFNGGGGLAAGPGMAVGAALALKDSGRIPICMCGDGDFLMGVTALWTAAHYRLPMLMVIYNNRSYFDDEMHQDRVARARGRPTQNRWIGQKIQDPNIDLVAMSRAQGARAFGPIETVDKLATAFNEAITAVEAGEVVVVEVLIIS